MNKKLFSFLNLSHVMNTYLTLDTKKYEKTLYNDKTISEFSDFEMATAYQRVWESIWQDYLDESTNN